MEISIADSTSKTSFPTPCTIWSDADLPAVVGFSVVNIELQRPTLVRLNQTEQVLAFVQD
jgi:hypothetical protein